MTNEHQARPDVDRIAADLGVTLLPWQREVMSLMLEARREGVPVTINYPRQNGRAAIREVMAAIDPEHPRPLERLPLWCRLRGHGWRRKRTPVYGSWTRRTCTRCRRA